MTADEGKALKGKDEGRREKKDGRMWDLEGYSACESGGGMRARHAGCIEMRLRVKSNLNVPVADNPVCQATSF